MKNVLPEVKYRGLKDDERAYLLRLSEFGKSTYEIIVIRSDPTIKPRISNVMEIEYVGKDYEKLYHELLERYDDLERETCLPRSNY